jgi:ParB-like nuclease domain
VVSSIQDIPPERIRESSSNPRRVFEDAQLWQLATNIQSHGVLQAILARPSRQVGKGSPSQAAVATGIRGESQSKSGDFCGDLSYISANHVTSQINLPQLLN